MVTRLREVIESDLAFSLEDEWGLPVVLIAPDGVIYNKSNNDSTKDLTGRIDYNTREVDPDSGGEVIVHKPSVTLRQTSLARIPLDTDKKNWVVSIPITPNYDGTKVNFFIREIVDGGSIGYITFHLIMATQS